MFIFILLHDLFYWNGANARVSVQKNYDTWQIIPLVHSCLTQIDEPSPYFYVFFCVFSLLSTLVSLFAPFVMISRYFFNLGSHELKNKFLLHYTDFLAFIINFCTFFSSFLTKTSAFLFLLVVVTFLPFAFLFVLLFL